MQPPPEFTEEMHHVGNEENDHHFQMILNFIETYSNLSQNLSPNILDVVDDPKKFVYHKPPICDFKRKFETIFCI
ncbi:hypothetical protein TRFO_27847 [Tritrichomonas foetus]|uniref:Uncharacterized protein n=1 Tax=Tritrichomonas foetus TaxID=1144522 RepID=A0A1J4K4H9_9EUKA|nr:hypothetical protein TRFO_27847 [Tritrichomonas foetus]|eukprot:OHT04590.1 hypothetical protein TRFO_27847 [Tritrichomonas foetus]